MRPMMLLWGLAAAMPHSPRSSVSGTKSADLEKRRMFASLAQFNFEPFRLTDVRMDCVRLNTTADYSCELKCEQ